MNVERNLLRVNPNFHNKEHFDAALIQVDGKQAIFVRLLFIFGIHYEGQLYHIALVLPMDIPCMQTNRGRDRKLRIRRVCPRPRALSAFIDVESIIRGALLTKNEGSNAGEYLVNHFIDQDMWLRMLPEHTELVTRTRI